VVALFFIEPEEFNKRLTVAFPRLLNSEVTSKLDFHCSKIVFPKRQRF